VNEPVEDPQLRFYLQRREMIETWAALAGREPAVVDRFLWSIAENIQERLAKDVVGAKLFVGEVDGDGIVGLYKPGWAVPESHPVAIVALSWRAGMATFSVRNRVAAIGLRARRSGVHAALRKAIQRLVCDTPIGNTFDDKKPRWAVYTWVPCTTENYWDDLGPYRSDLVSRLFAAWELLAAPVDQALAEAGWSGVAEVPEA